jgi:hypothetical protein
MKAFVNYEGFVREVFIDEAHAILKLPLRIYLGENAPIIGDFSLIKVCETGIEKNGRWTFESVAYYQLKD